MIGAHQAEIMDLDYSRPEADGGMLLASAARDRMIRVFSVVHNHYELLQTLEDHSAAITAVKFCFSSIEKQLYLTSCGFDKSLMLRSGNVSVLFEDKVCDTWKNVSITYNSFFFSRNFFL